ncbi:putative inactive peptidyl-prolyl cis-trans isomerase-like 6 isoform 3-T3 [Spinachia spinachia]
MDTKIQLEITGLIKEHTFHVATSIAKALKQKFPELFLDPKIQPLMEMDWHTYLSQKKREMRGEVWQYSSSLMCFADSVLLGNEEDLVCWAKNKWSFSFTRPQVFYMALTEDYYTKHLRKTGESEVCPRAASHFATRAPCFIVWYLMAGSKVEIFLQKGKVMAGSQYMVQHLKMRALPCPIVDGALSEWPIKAPIAMDPSFTSPCSQPPGWTGPMLLSGLYHTYLIFQCCNTLALSYSFTQA